MIRTLVYQKWAGRTHTPSVTPGAPGNREGAWGWGDTSIQGRSQKRMSQNITASYVHMIEVQCLLHSFCFFVSFKLLKMSRSLQKREYMTKHVVGKSDYIVVTGLAHTFHCVPVEEKLQEALRSRHRECSKSPEMLLVWIAVDITIS